MLELVKRVGIFIICAQCLMHFTAGKEYEKYIKLLIGLMILGQFVVPLRTIFLGKEAGELWEQIESFQQEVSEITEDNKITYDINDNLEEPVMEEIKLKIDGSAEEFGYEINEVFIEGAGGSEKLIVVLAPTKETVSEIRIEPVYSGSVQLDKGEDNTEKENITDHGNRIDNENIKEEFASRLSIDADYIELRKKK